MDLSWTYVGPSLIAAFLASLVEFIEALTVILAVGSVCGWRDALYGTAAALLILGLLVTVLGPALSLIPLTIVQVAVGSLLLLFGMRWLRKAILRASGHLPLHDEDETYTKQKVRLGEAQAAGTALSRLAFGTAFKITMLEGIEVVFIVIAIGASGRGLLMPAIFGAIAAFVAVALLGVILHKPISRIPENQLKFIVGVLLSSFGTFWVGEGFGLAWPAGDWALLMLIGGFLAIALAGVALSRHTAAPSRP